MEPARNFPAAGGPLSEKWSEIFPQEQDRRGMRMDDKSWISYLRSAMSQGLAQTGCVHGHILHAILVDPCLLSSHSDLACHSGRPLPVVITP